MICLLEGQNIIQSAKVCILNCFKGTWVGWWMIWYGSNESETVSEWTMQSSLISLPKWNIPIEIFTKVISTLIQIARSPILCKIEIMVIVVEWVALLILIW